MTLYVRTSGYSYKDWKDRPVTRIDHTADWGYLHLRRVEYADANLKEWLKCVGHQEW